jgi:hypothetical protein
VAAVGAFCVHAYATLSAQVHENHLFAAVPLLVLASAGREAFRPICAGVSAVVALSFSPLSASAQSVPATGPSVDQSHVDIVYGDGDEGAIYVGPITVTARPTTVDLAPGDMLFGDNDEGAIAEGPAQVTADVLDVANAPQAAPDLIFAGDDEGGMPVDLSAFRGRGNITWSELNGGASNTLSAVDAMQASDGCY